MHKPTLMLALAGGLALSANTANAEDKFSTQAMQYREDDQRMDIDYITFGLEKDFGTDYSLKLDYGYDAISGATPVWKPHPNLVGEFVESRQTLPKEVRRAGSGALTVRDAARNEYTVGAAYSDEPDFKSAEISGAVMLWHDELHNRSYNAGIGVQNNTAIATPFTNNARDADSRVYNVQVGITEILNATNTLEATLFGARETGYLSNHYLKTVRLQDDGSKLMANDSRPDKRNSLGFTLRWIRAWLPVFTSNLWYRFYRDSWAIAAHTVESKLYWDATPWLRVNPVYRWQWQDKADFYRAYNGQPNMFATTGYGSNDARLGRFTVQTAQLNLEFRPVKQHSFNIGFSHYWQSNGFAADWLTAGYIWKF
ncbi:DUF3570 domain-containing protein [Chitinimonas sp. PSY-7]|uniref:DUF3570 domain-containing protein n=1 Tax=Chitinimonas sp. PSY-7 TaxID=3459088 RepID=UPI004040389A